jgi:alkylation response protein AidB-like acyl-CoA dehydrogenase
MTKNPEISSTDLQPLQGGEFLIKDQEAKDIFIPEDFDEEQLMVRNMCLDFLNKEVKPNLDELEKKKYELAETMLRKMGGLGLLGTHISEAYGGMELDTNTNTLICDTMGPAASFNTTYAAHTGIGMLPVLYFGNEEKSKNIFQG